MTMFFMGMGHCHHTSRHVQQILVGRDDGAAPLRFTVVVVGFFMVGWTVLTQSFYFHNPVLDDVGGVERGVRLVFFVSFAVFARSCTDGIR